MQQLKNIIAQNFTSFAFFFRILRYRIFVAVSISIVVGILDGFGLAMFLPLLQLISEAETADPEGLGNLRFIVEGFQSLGLTLNLTTVLGILTGFFIFKGLAIYFGNVYQIHIQQFFLRAMRLGLVQALNQISFKEYVISDVGRIQNTFTTETERITTAFIHYFRAVNLLVMLLVYVGFAFAVDARFAFLVTLGGGLTHLLYRLVYQLSRKVSRAVTSDNHRFQGLVLQYIGNFKYLKATGRLTFYGEKIKKNILQIEEKNRKLGIYAAFLAATREPIMIIIISAVILLQTQLLGASLAPILISLLFFYRALTSLNNLQSTWNLFIKFSGSIENMIDFQGQLQDKKERVGKNQFSHFEDRLELEQVDFYYGDTQVLDTVNLVVKKNESVAFVGESGSGKTTLVCMLAGLLPPDQGVFTIDGKNAAGFNIESYQQRIGFISQDPVVFNDTIFNNVTLWSEPHQENIVKFWKVLEQASIQDFVQNLPEKEKTILGNNGINLSGGQKQRLSIARELYKDIDILIMDEATSALDSETEKMIQQNIAALKGKYTLLMVAHRLSTVKDADRIVLMDTGKIVNVQPFDLLVQEEEKFRRMVELQEI